VANLQSVVSRHASASLVEDTRAANLCVFLCADALEHAAWTRGEKYLQPLRHDLSAFQMGSWDVILIALTLVLAVVALALCLAYYMVCCSIRLAAGVRRRLPIAKHDKAL